MFKSFSTYRGIMVVALAVLMTVSCFAKKEIKQWLNIETSQQSKPNQTLTACNTFCQLQKHDKTEKEEKHTPPSPLCEITKEHSVVAIAIPLPDFYSSQKEKISSYLLFERFLI